MNNLRTEEFIDIMIRLSQNSNSLISGLSGISDDARRVIENIVEDERTPVGDGDNVFTIPIRKSDFLMTISHYSSLPIEVYLDPIRDNDETVIGYMTRKGNRIQFIDLL